MRETYVEGTAFDDWRSVSAIRTPFDMFSATGGDTDLRVVPAADTVRLAMRADTRAMLARDAQQFMVVAPQDVASDREGWWRIDPQTGSAIGVLPDGRGAGNLVVYAALISLVAVFAARAIGAYGRCLKVLKQEAQMCVGSLMNVLTGDFAEPYVDDHLSECFQQEFSLIADSREPECQWGNEIGQEPCPDWQQPFSN